jgi:DNA-binding winged helix-turn-helix (wHTH) protein/Flp pilus assembly protein TadD
VPVSRLCAFGPYRLDLERRLLLRGTQPVPLHPKALEILILLVQHRGEVVSKDVLMNAIWPDAFVEEGNLSQNVFVLRKTLGERAQENRYIATVPGRGYSFVASLEEILECTDDPRKETASEQVLGARSVHSQNNLATFSWLRTKPDSLGTWALILLGIGTILVAGVLILSPRIARAFNNQGVMYQQSGDVRRAIKDYRWALRFRSGYAAAHYNLGDANEEIPNYENAVEQYQRAIDADPTFYSAYNNLSRLYIMQRRDPAAALRLLDRALSLQPQEPWVQYTIYKNYGWANLELGQLGEAEQNLRRAESLDSRRGSAHCLLAKVLARLSRPNDALAQWESCLALSNMSDVEPEWRNEAKENLRNALQHPTGGLK